MKATLESAQQVRLLSLFSVFGPDQQPTIWRQEDRALWSIEASDGLAQVQAQPEELDVRRPGASTGWTVDLEPSY